MSRQPGPKSQRETKSNGRTCYVVSRAVKSILHWALLTHQLDTIDFRVVQNRHEKARRLAQIGEGGQFQTVSGFNFASGSTSNSPIGGTNPTSVNQRKPLGGSIRKDNTHSSTTSGSKPLSSVLSPLNPRRGGGSMSTGTSGGNGSLSALSLGAPFSSSMQVGAAAGATGPTVVNRPKSPPARSRVRGILPGLRKG